MSLNRLFRTMILGLGIYSFFALVFMFLYLVHDIKIHSSVAPIVGFISGFLGVLVERKLFKN